MDIEVLGRADTPDGEVVLRRRGLTYELIVNGVFAMDTVDVSSELILAQAAGTPPGRVLVGGLGLGFTTTQLLTNQATAIDIVERAAPLVEWARAGVTDQLGRIAADPRVTLHACDVVGFVRAATSTWDAILLDVDNGPSFLIHDDNAEVYQAGFLADCLGRLTPGGRLVVWCETASPPLELALRRLTPAVESLPVPIAREGREFSYTLYRATRCKVTP